MNDSTVPARPNSAKPKPRRRHQAAIYEFTHTLQREDEDHEPYELPVQCRYTRSAGSPGSAEEPPEDPEFTIQTLCDAQGLDRQNTLMPDEVVELQQAMEDNYESHGPGSDDDHWRVD